MKPVKIRPAKDIPAAPRGLGGYCWAEHPTTFAHCTEPVGHKHREHYHAYSRTSWRD